MVGWRTLASCLSVLVLATAAQAQTHLLQEKKQADSYYHVELKMELKGKLVFQEGGKPRELAQQATADHDFVERVLNEGDQGLIAKSARCYATAKASITVDKNKLERALPAAKALIATRRTKQGSLQSFSPDGPLTREDLDVLEHFDTLAVPGLLPTKELAVGATWKVSDAAAQGLCYFEGLTTNNLTGKLEQVKDQKATLAITGDARGIFAGADVKLKVNATAVFDMAVGRITSLTWNQQDDREQGPASPAMSAQVTVKLTRELVQPVKELSDFPLVKALAALTPPETPAANLAVAYHDHKGRYQLSHDRAWTSVARTDDHLVLRLLDRGDFVAQVSISCWPKAGAGKHADVNDFKTAMERTQGWAQEVVKEAGEVKSDNGYFIHRLAAQGTLNGQPTVQYFYLVAGPNGDQTVLAFAMTPLQAEKLGTRDLDLVRSLTFPTATKAAPTP